MARPKSKVTLDNAFSITRYFQRALDEHSELASFSDFEHRFQAKRDFKALPSDKVLFQKEASKNDKFTYLRALQAWLDQYIVQADWHRCLTTLRQRRFTHRERIKTVKLRASVYLDVQNYAEKLGASLEAAIHKAIMIASKKITPKAG